jgi:hypothetical protein
MVEQRDQVKHLLNDLKKIGENYQFPIAGIRALNPLESLAMISLTGGNLILCVHLSDT